MLGKKLEDMQAGREDRLPQISAAIEPLRKALARARLARRRRRPTTPTTASSGRSCSSPRSATSRRCAEDDPLRDWIERCLDLFGGLGRHPGLSPIFGLPQREDDPEPFVRDPPEGGLNRRNTGPQSTAAETARLKGQDGAD